MNTEKIRIHYVFHGNVQGVGFRYKACYSAKNRGVTGWVRNEYDGSVSTELQGLEEDIDKIVQALYNDRYIIRALDEHSWGCIDSIDSENIPVEGGYGFEIR